MMPTQKLELASNCCFCFSLANGVMIIATIDLLQGILTVILGAACLMMPDTLKGHPLGGYESLHLLRNLLTLCLYPSAPPSV
jgi:hypothetical protein